jgi:hypothetical protein
VAAIGHQEALNILYSLSNQGPREGQCPSRGSLEMPDCPRNPTRRGYPALPSGVTFPYLYVMHLVRRHSTKTSGWWELALVLNRTWPPTQADGGESPLGLATPDRRRNYNAPRSSGFFPTFSPSNHECSPVWKDGQGSQATVIGHLIQTLHSPSCRANAGRPGARQRLREARLSRGQRQGSTYTDGRSESLAMCRKLDPTEPCTRIALNQRSRSPQRPLVSDLSSAFPWLNGNQLGGNADDRG